MKTNGGLRELFGSIMALLLLVACETGLHQRSGIALHGWSPLTTPLNVPWKAPETALYTYVLSGDAAGGSAEAAASRERTNARESLTRLLAEVQANQKASSISDADLLAQANQFVVPAKNYRDGKLELEQYDFEKSVAILNRIRPALDLDIQARLDRPGPFLLAMRRPINEFPAIQAAGKPPMLVMLVDMSGSHPEAVPVYLTGFKAGVRKGIPEKFGNALMMRAELTSVVLKANEAIPFVAAAYAGTMKLLSPANGGNDAAAGKPD